MALVAVTNAAEVQKLSDGGMLPVILHFWAGWAPMCAQTKEIASRLAGECPNVRFANVEAEEAEDLAEAYNVESVPAFVFIPTGGGKPELLVGANAPEITKKAMLFNSVASGGHTHTSACAHSACGGHAHAAHGHDGHGHEHDSHAHGHGDEPMDLQSRLKQLTTKEPVMLFMKGTPGAEKCGFSRTITSLLSEHGVAYGSFDILADEEVRQGLKAFSNWPTYPQVYANGKLIGGLDIVKELIENGELHEALGVVPQGESLNARLEKLVNKEPVMLFMKGEPAAAKCGFSRTIVNILNEQGVAFGSFDILSDEEVRQGLKEYSKWPTYPQLYSKGKLIGGLDIIKELIEAGEFKDALD